jgi:hypothetical protein
MNLASVHRLNQLRIGGRGRATVLHRKNDSYSEHQGDTPAVQLIISSKFAAWCVAYRGKRNLQITAHVGRRAERIGGRNLKATVLSWSFPTSETKGRSASCKYIRHLFAHSVSDQQICVCGLSVAYVCVICTSWPIDTESRTTTDCTYGEI